MNLLKELLLIMDPLRLQEAEIPIELKRLFGPGVSDNFSQKALAKLWGGQRLIWHGDKFFSDEQLGPAYQGALNAAEKIIDDGDSDTEASIDINTDEMSDTMTWTVQFGRNGDGQQEVYLGYDPIRDKLYIGFDAWASEEGFNEAFDKQFEEMHGESYDSDNESHDATFRDTFKQYQEQGFGFWGLIYEISHNGGDYQAEEAMSASLNGFYRGMFKEFKSKHPHVVDLRLD